MIHAGHVGKAKGTESVPVATFDRQVAPAAVTLRCRPEHRVGVEGDEILVQRASGFSAFALPHQAVTALGGAALKQGNNCFAGEGDVLSTWNRFPLG